MLLETPKEQARAKGIIEVDPLDAKNLATLRALIHRAGGAGEAGGAGG
jgi:hypothetical protein